MLVILDFGSAHSQLVARQIRAQKVYCEVLPYTVSLETLRDKAAAGIILVGDERDVTLQCTQGIWDLAVPLLGVGYGARYMLERLGAASQGRVATNELRAVEMLPGVLTKGVSSGKRFLERVDRFTLPDGFSVCAEVSGTAAAFQDETRRLYGMQFVPENKDPEGMRALRNFAIDICGCTPDWTMQRFVREKIEEIRAQVGDGNAVLAMSGGVDSSVCAVLMHRAIGDRLHCIYVNTGLMRLGESEQIEHVFREQMGLSNLKCIDAEARFLGKLAGVTEPERKRKIIGEEFIRVFEEEARGIGKVDFLVQGTIYPDVIESGVGSGLVKSHHNVGGLPDAIDFKSIIEPVRELFKDEVRGVGEVLGLPGSVVYRQPFPGPGLAVRCLGEVNKPRLDMLRQADAIFREEIANAGLDKQIWQYFVVLTDLKSVGVRSVGSAAGERSYEYTVALRAIHSVDAMTATSVRLPYDLIERTVERITTQVAGINRVVLDVTGKPPSTIEWE